MSATLMWRPAGKGRSLPYDLRRMMEKRHPSWEGELSYKNSDLGWLSGLRDAEVDGAAELMEAIETHGEVFLWREY